MKKNFQLSTFNFQLNTGFTLVEILISIGIVSIIAGIGISIFVALNATYDKAAVVTNLTHEGGRVMEVISRAVRSASDAQSLSGGSTLQLTIPREDNNLEYANNGQCSQVEIFYHSPTLSVRKQSLIASCEDGSPPCLTTAPCVLTSDGIDVLDLVFTVTDNVNAPDAVVIDFNIRQDASLSDPQQQASQQFQKTVLTRGY